MPLSLSGRGQPQEGKGHPEGTWPCQGQMALHPALIDELVVGKLPFFRVVTELAGRALAKAP